MEPKYNIGDTVTFNLTGEKIVASVYWVDENGTFEIPDEVCYDVLGEINGVETLIKHIPESWIL